MKIRPTIWSLLAVAAPLTAALAGCAGATTGGGTSGGSLGGSQPAASATVGDASPANTSPVAEAAGTRCHTSELKVTTAENPGGGAAGTVGVWLVFTNTSNRTCTMYGFPGVSFVAGPSGQQVNDPATRLNVTPTKVSLAPQGSGHVDVLISNPGNYGPDCKPAQVDGFRVYPPDETASVFVNALQTACSAKGVGVPQVGPVKPGAHD